MKRHSIEPRDHIFVTGYENLYFAKNTAKIIGKSMSKDVISKYSQKSMDHAKFTL